MTHRILLADDSATIRKVVELTFSDEDFAIDSVGDGSQAFEHARAQRPDIVISDVIMPGLNGYELCQRFKTDPVLQSVPFLFLKGTFESFDEDKARSCGADGFIVKPFESQEMIAKVKDLIGRAVAPPAPVAVLPTPTPAELRSASVPEDSGFPPAVPSPDIFAPRPLVQQRPAPAPPPIPTLQTRPAPTPPATPAFPARPAPPIPPWPVRPVPVTPPSPTPPPQPAPPMYQPPPPPPPVYQPPPPPAPPAAAQAPVDDFGFDFGEPEDERFGAVAAPPSASKGAAPPLEPPGESDEDLWSEVTLRGNTSDLLEDHGHAGSGGGSRADIMDLTEDAAIIAPDVLFEDEAVFEEVSTARMMPVLPVVEPPVAREEPPVTTPVVPLAVSEPAIPVPATPEPAAPEPTAPITIDQAEIERIVSSRVDAAVRQILEPLVGDLARTMIESVAWEVIPDLAEAMIRAEIERVRQSTRTD